MSTAPRSWPSLPSPSRGHLQRSRKKGSCQHFPLVTQSESQVLLVACFDGSLDGRKGRQQCCPRGREGETEAPRGASGCSEPLGEQQQGAHAWCSALPTRLRWLESNVTPKVSSSADGPGGIPARWPGCHPCERGEHRAALAPGKHRYRFVSLLSVGLSASLHLPPWPRGSCCRWSSPAVTDDDGLS